MSCRTPDFRKLENIEKFQIRADAQTVSVPEINLGNSSKKERRSRYQTFLVLPNFTGFPYYVTNIVVFILVQKLLTKSIS